MINSYIFEEVVISEVRIRFFTVVPPCDFQVVGNERTEAFTHFVLTELVLVVVHFFVLGFWVYCEKLSRSYLGTLCSGVELRLEMPR